MNTERLQAPQGDLRASTGKILLRINDACDALGIGRSTLYRLIAEGKLRTVKVYGATRVTDESIQAFAASLAEAA